LEQLQSNVLGNTHIELRGVKMTIAAVAIGSGFLATSIDGSSWIEKTPFVQPQETAYGNGRWVVPDYDPDLIWISTDGINWVSSNTGISDATWYCVTFGGGQFVMGGSKDVGYPTSIIATSSDGLVWTEQTVPDGAYVDSLSYWNSKYLGGDEYHGVIHSSNGIDWTRVNPSGGDKPFYWFGDLSYGTGTYVVCGRDNYIYSSSDLVIWTPQNSGITEVQLSLMSSAYGAGVFVIVGRYGVLIYSVDGGTTWVEASPLHSGGPWFLDVIYSTEFNKFIAVGRVISSTIEIWSSVDGMTWNQDFITTSTAEVNCVCMGEITSIPIPTTGNLMRCEKWFSGQVFQGYYLGDK
jgi:hypothetical protein